MNRAGWLWSVGVVAAALAPLPIKTHLRPAGALHPYAHMLVFCAGVLVTCHRMRSRTWACFLPSCVALAFFSEFAEVLRFGIVLERNDVMADLTGILLGIGILLAWKGSPAQR